MKKARYFGIPCYFNPETTDLRGRNKFYSFLLEIALWVDINIIGVEGFVIHIKDEN